MPFLETKGHITLLTVGDEPLNTGWLVQTLERHGVPADAVSVAPRGSIANTILQESEARGARLIVMGAYEHSKFTHDLTGGVTTALLAQAQIPVLIAH